MDRSYGWKPDLPDQRDFRFRSVAPPVSGPLPASVDLRPLCPPVQDQGELGSCTAHAWAGAVGFCEYRDKIKRWDPSRLFIYYNERAIEGTISQDSGSELRDGAKALAQYGVCPEPEWPYNTGRFAAKPSKVCFSDAAKRKIQGYYRVNQVLSDMQGCLAQGYPFVLGFSVYESFESEAVAQSGIVPMPDQSEQLLGGHAVLCVGYDTAKQLFLVRNSWGTSWGQKGYFWIPFAYLLNSDLSSDFWTLRTGTGI